MSDSQRIISIPAKFFQGEGKLPFHVHGRESGDDDDTSMLVLADSRDQAEDMLIEEVLGCLPWERDEMDREAWEEKHENNPEYYILGCDALFDTKTSPDQPE